MTARRGSSDGGEGVILTLRQWVERAYATLPFETDRGTEEPDATDRGTEEPDATSSGDPLWRIADESLRPSECFEAFGMTREECIVRGIEAHGGRLRQQTIVERTGWSATTISRILSEMEADELVVRVQTGRENVVCLPDALPGPSANSGSTQVGDDRTPT